MGNSTFDVAWKLHVSGFNVIPSGGGDAGKAPIVDWREYQTRQPTDDEIIDWNDSLSPKLWGLTTNSTMAVIDADTIEARDELIEELGGDPHIITPRQGGHWYVDTTGHALPTKAGVLPGVDIRGEGGFVNVCGRSSIGEYTILTLPSFDNLIPHDRIPGRILEALNGNKRRPDPAEPIMDGQRNATLASIGGSWRREGLEEAEIVEGLLRINAKRCQPPLPDSEVLTIASSIARYTTGNSNSIYSLPKTGQTASDDNKATTRMTTSGGVSQADIEEWVSQTNGAWFSNEELDRELGYTTREQKKQRAVVLTRLASRVPPVVIRHPVNNRLTRKTTSDARLIDFKQAGKRTPLNIGLPFDIHKKVNIYPGNVIVLAGAPNAGKTAFMLTTIRLNMYDFPIYYFSSEMGAEELAIRLEKFPGMELDDWRFEARERAGNYADAIVPDAINVIDYWEFSGGEAFYQIGEGLRAVWEKLGTGIAIVALQKGRNRDIGRGGEFGLEKPRLYLSMGAGRLTIVKGKNRANPAVNPDGLTCDFSLTDGCNFRITREWYHREGQNG